MLMLQSLHTISPVLDSLGLFLQPVCRLTGHLHPSTWQQVWHRWTHLCQYFAGRYLGVTLAAAAPAGARTPVHELAVSRQHAIPALLGKAHR